MPNQVLIYSGTALLVLGVIAAIFAVIQAIVQMVKAWSRAGRGVNYSAMTTSADSTTEVLKALAEALKETADLIRALTAAPIWLALIFAGAALILVGR